jgi:hypothetical protein
VSVPTRCKTRRRARAKARKPSRRAADQTRLDENGLEPKQAAFVLEYVKDGSRNGTRAYMRVYGIKSPKSAGTLAARLMANDLVLAAIDAEELRLARELRIEAKDVIGSIICNVRRANEIGDLTEVRKGNELLGRWKGLNLWRDTVAHTGAGGGPLQVQQVDPAKLTTDELRKLDAIEGEREEILSAAQVRP